MLGLKPSSRHDICGALPTGVHVRVQGGFSVGLNADVVSSTWVMFESKLSIWHLLFSFEDNRA